MHVNKGTGAGGHKARPYDMRGEKQHGIRMAERGHEFPDL